MEHLKDHIQNALSERDLKDKLLQALYAHGGSADVIQLCADNNIAFKSASQRSRVLESLKENGLIKGTFFINGGGLISITSAGAEYVEELGKQQPKEEPFEPFEQEESSKPNYAFFAKSQKQDFSIKTFDESPCFDVEKLSDIFADHIHSMSNESSQMIGIFGRWGRGKTYFWQQTKKQLKTKHSEKYIFVEFNAWKYQETPAIWAYLYKTFENTLFGTGCCKKFKLALYNFVQNKWTTLLHFFIILCFVASLILVTLKDTTIIGENAEIIVLILSAACTGWVLIKQIRDNILTSIDKIRSILRGKDHSKYLGCQAELELDLESLICYHVSLKSGKRIVLFIDDIDRCDDKKMLSVVDSLRTILENKEICKRLIIVCAVDGERLKSAIATKYEGVEMLDTKDKTTAASQLAREQIDKLFISGIKLCKLSQDEKVEYLISLFGDKITPELKLQITTTFTSSSEDAEKEQDEDIGILDNSKALESFSDAMNKGILDDATPRQLKITYYRYLLANNILGGAPVQHDMLIKAIYDGTCGNCGDYSKFDPEFNKVLNTVVCY